MRSILLLCLALAACSKGPEADLASIGKARSLGAEWALVNEQAMKGRLTATYVRTMREELRRQLQTTHASLAQPRSRYAEEIQALIEEPGDARPQDLRAHAARLKAIEVSLESA